MPVPPYHVHPILVHFPIALCFVAGFFEWVVALIFPKQKERWQWVAACLLWTGTVFAGLAIATGLWAESTAPAIPSAWDTVGLHKKLGIAVGVLGLILSLWRALRRPPASPRPLLVYVLLWIALMGAVSLTGYYGGNLVFNFGVGVDATN